MSRCDLVKTMTERNRDGFGNRPTEPWVMYQRKNDPKWYRLWLGSKAIVDPASKAKGTEKVRGRECVVLWIGDVHSGKVGIRYLDSGCYGKKLPCDLIPLAK